MQFDDRLATVLRSGVGGERAARTQFRQLLDLLGSASPHEDSPFVEAAYDRLGELFEALPAVEQSRILREPGLRLRNARLVVHLAQGEPQVAAAAVAAARLDESDWVELIPTLSVTARGFLRHRRDLPDSVRRLLARLGVRDLVLTQAQAAEDPAPETPVTPIGDANGGIGALVRRIEAFQQARRGSPAPAARLPLDIGELMADVAMPDSIDFSTDSGGRVDWTDPQVAPLLVGLRLIGGGGTGQLCDPVTEVAFRRRSIVRSGRVDLPGAELVAGPWRIDATPRFDSETGAFGGYVGRLRRPLTHAVDVRGDHASDRMRQVLHELRTPVNAIQGFAEIIQQQLFGSAPNAYRALAGAIGVDAARLLAGFDELDRLARLESAGLELSSDGCNFRVVVESTVRRLEGVTRPRSAHLRLLTSGEGFSVRLGEADSALLAWRLLASLAGALGAGEVAELSLRGDDRGIELESELPVALAGEEDLFAAAARNETAAVTAGMFGTGFTLRLARAEAEAAGGSLVLRGETLVLSLPGLTPAAPDHSQDENGATSVAG